jgi:siroheme synthase-like protein
MTHFPLFLDLKDREVLICGGGAFALQRVEKLKPFMPKIRVVSEEVSDAVRAITGITIEERAFREEDLDTAPAFVVIAEDEETTAKIYAVCQKRHIPVNAVDMPKYCDIIFPSVISTKHLCVGISSGGISPTATVEFKSRIEELLPENLDEILEWMPCAKAYVTDRCEKSVRNAILRQVFREALSLNRPLAESEIDVLL